MLCENLGVNLLCTVEVSCIPSLCAFRENRNKWACISCVLSEKVVEFCENQYVHSFGTLSETWPQIQCVLCQSFGLNILRTTGVLSVNQLCTVGAVGVR